MPLSDKFLPNNLETDIAYNSLLLIFSSWKILALLLSWFLILKIFTDFHATKHTPTHYPNMEKTEFLEKNNLQI